MSQKKVYLYSPDGQAEGWYMEDDAPAGWLRQNPVIKDHGGDGVKPDELPDKPDNGEPPPQEAPESGYQGSVQPGTPSDEQQAKDDQDSIDPELEDLKQKVAEAEAE